jgi:hypothetical protein
MLLKDSVAILVEKSVIDMELVHCKRVCAQGHVCDVVILPQVYATITVFKLLHAERSFIRAYFELATAHISWGVHRTALQSKAVISA